MKYLVRAVKYFFYLCIVLVVIVVALQLLHLTEGGIEDMFVHGYDSLWQMALIIAAFAAIYPRYGYGTRSLHLEGNPSDAIGAIEEFMRERGYVRVVECACDGKTDAAVRFRKASILARISRMFEDEVTFTPTLTGYDIEGLTREITRIDTALSERL